MMKQLPDIAASVAFWASVGTLWGAAGAWFTYAGAAKEARRQFHDGLMNLIAGVEAELDLVSAWASGGEGDKGYLLSKTRVQLVKEHQDWFNPSRMIFKFDTPALSSLTSSPYARPVGELLPSFVQLNHAIRQLLDYMDRLHGFVMGSLGLYQRVMEKFGAKDNPLALAASPTPMEITVPLVHTIEWSQDEKVYINHIFMMNEGIHQRIIGSEEGPPGCLYLTFRKARKELADFKAKHLTPQRAPRWHWALHIVAGFFVVSGIWQVLRWYGAWPKGW
ncbi:MAG TPA: hypothetical protein VF011_18745 [Terriglobales bacterium]